MFVKAFYCVFSVMSLVYFDRELLRILPPQTELGRELSRVRSGDLPHVPASIASRIRSSKAGSMMQETLSKKHNKRDLSAYDEAGPYSLKPSLDARTRTTLLTALREFIWEHWHERSLGRVVTTFYSKEGEPIMYSFFIEANEKGDWCVAVEVSRLLVSRGGSRGKYSETDKFVADTVERIEVSAKKGEIRAIPKDVPREPQSYKLRLIDEKGNVRFEV